MSEVVDVSGPWTIKNILAETREAITVGARKEGLTVGQWLERRVREWTEAGEPVRVSHTESADVADRGKALSPEPSVADMAALLRAMGEAQAAGVSRAVLAQVGGFLMTTARAKRGLPPLTHPRRLKPPEEST